MPTIIESDIIADVVVVEPDPHRRDHASRPPPDLIAANCHLSHFRSVWNWLLAQAPPGRVEWS